MVGCVSAQFLVVLVEGCMEKLDGSHLRHQVQAQHLENLEVRHDEVGCCCEPQFIGCTACCSINFSKFWAVGCCNEVREGQFRGFRCSPWLSFFPMVGVFFLGDVRRASAIRGVDSVVPDFLHQLLCMGIHGRVRSGLPCDL